MKSSENGKSKSVQPKPEARAAWLLQQQKMKMARSAHAYVRGNTAKFYEWLETATGKVPDGPGVWICGDCHVGNLGPVAAADGKVKIEIRDLDQTMIGNPAHDLIRLGLSLAMAVRGSDLPGVTTAEMMEQMVLGYESALAGKDRKQPGKIRPVQIVLKEALRRKWRHLATERIEDVKPSIPLGKNFWAMTPGEKKEIHRIFETKEAKALVTSLKSRKDHANVEVVDAAYWMKGCSSLGRLRYAALVRVGDDLCLMDLKEAVHAAAPAYKLTPGPRTHAERVVEGARNLAPSLGERMLATKFGSTQVVMRELRPQDLKLEMDRLTREETTRAAHFLAGVVGKAHARQMDAATRKSWRRDLQKDRGRNIEAPSWLWTSVVDLIAGHEVAYLEHCRRYALGCKAAG